MYRVDCSFRRRFPFPYQTHKPTAREHADWAKVRCTLEGNPLTRTLMGSWPQILEEFPRKQRILQAVQKGCQAREASIDPSLRTNRQIRAITAMISPVFTSRLPSHTGQSPTEIEHLVTS